MSSSTSAVVVEIVIEEEAVPVEKAFAFGIVNSLEKGAETAEKLSVSATSVDPATLATSSSGVILLQVLSSADARSVGTLLARRAPAGTKALQYGAAKARSNPEKFNFIFPNLSCIDNYD
mmetsp:Transcript_26591/g.43935  ORF Transcript_26591/g.43935 Transcript_26591/m.43935 type:complete len:120 (+) Transcript_26591:635-994(+)